MDFLSERNIYHGDLAARNVLLGNDPTNANTPLAKVADFGLAKNFYEYLTYEKKNRKLVPWKWMAPEYLQTGCFTITSDVWSFGIVIWEIFSLGKEPYVGKNVEEMILKLKERYHLPCPEEVAKVRYRSIVQNNKNVKIDF